MARPSKLTEKQWAEVERRNVGGESIRSLAKEFKVSPSIISERISEHVPKQKKLAETIAYAETAFDSLTVSEQVSVRSLADTLKAISYHLGSSARYGAMTSHRLSGIAHGQVEKIDDADPINATSLETLKGIAVLTKMANASSELGVNLLRANKEAIDQLNNPEADSAKLLRDIADMLPG